MGIHKSLKPPKSGSKKTVNKRIDRIKKLIKEDKMDINNLKIYGLPKEKIIKMKIKKEKKEEETKLDGLIIGE